MIVWYKETHGYLAVDTEREGRAGMVYARAAAIDGLPTSMSTESVSHTYLEECCAIIPTEQVPEDWVRYANIGGN